MRRSHVFLYAYLPLVHKTNNNNDNTSRGHLDGVALCWLKDYDRVDKDFHKECFPIFIGMHDRFADRNDVEIRYVDEICAQLAWY